jgi:hypothetical protein
MLEGRAEVQRVYESLASLGIVDQVGDKHLGIFKTCGTRRRTMIHRPRS